MKKTLNFLMAKRVLAITVMAGLTMMLHSASVFAQTPSKEKKAKKPAFHRTLPETEVTASLHANLLQVSPLRVNLNLLNPTGRIANLSIRNYGGAIVFQEAFREKEINRAFDFSHALSGTYSFNINGHKYHEIKPFKILVTINRTLKPGVLQNENASKILAAIYETEPLKIRLHLVNNSGKVAEYYLRNEKDEVIYRGQTGEAKFSKTFDMKGVNIGKYTIEVKNRDEEISRTFDVLYSEERSFVWLDKRGQPIKPASTAFQPDHVTR